MIIDKIKNAALYYGISKHMETALKYLQSRDFSQIEAGRYEIDGTDVFMLVQEYETRPLAKGRWEAHRNYYDIQFVVQGPERMGYTHLNNLEVTEPYNPEKDIMRLAGSGDFFLCEAGTFAIFGPEDAHMPNIAVEEPVAARKVVMKVRV